MSKVLRVVTIAIVASVVYWSGQALSLSGDDRIGKRLRRDGGSRWRPEHYSSVIVYPSDAASVPALKVLRPKLLEVYPNVGFCSDQSEADRILAGVQAVDSSAMVSVAVVHGQDYPYLRVRAGIVGGETLNLLYFVYIQDEELKRAATTIID